MRPSPHLDTDDTQIFGASLPSHLDVNECLSAVADCMDSNRLQLNNDKTEFLWCTNSRHQHRLPAVGPTIGSSHVMPSSAASDLDSDLSMRTPVNRTVFVASTNTLRQLRNIRRQVPTAVFQSLVVALVLSRLDYCNGVLAGVPAKLIPKSSQ